MNSFVIGHLRGGLGDSFWAGLNGDQIDGINSQLVVTYWGIDPYSLDITFKPELNEFLISNLKTPSIPPDIVKNVLGINFSGIGYSAPLMNSSNIKNFLDTNVSFFKQVNTANFSIPNSNLITDSYIPGDFNGDGIIDIAVFRLNWNSNPSAPVQILKGDGKGGFIDATQTILPSLPITHFVARAFSADINGDGISDLFCIDTGEDVAPWSGGQNELFLSNSKGLLTNATNKLPQIIEQNHGAAIGDVNNDGRPDILTNPIGFGEKNELYIQDNSGAFITSPNLLPLVKTYTDSYGRGQVPVTNTWSALIDVNGDGYLDMILGDWPGVPSEISSQIYINDGHGSFANSIPINLPKTGLSSEIIVQIVPIDLNSDGLSDLILSATDNYQHPYIQFLINKGTGQFVDETQTRLPQIINKQFIDSGWYKYLNVVDLNHDGNSDIVAIGDGSPGLVAFLNDGKGNFNQIFRSSILTGYGASADLNNDGMTDFLTANSDASNVSTWLNQLENLHVYKANFGGDVLLGSNQNDTFFPRDGLDLFDGNDGIDCAYFPQSIQSYKLEISISSSTISDNTYIRNVVKLKNIERLIFTDKSLAIDISGNAGTVAKVLGAVFGKSSLSNKSYVGIGLSLLDKGMSYSDLAALALNAAGSTTPDQIVTTLWTNVIGSAPGSADKAPFIQMLASGTKVGDLAVMAADTSFNTTNINLTGLAQTGIEYTPA